MKKIICCAAVLSCLLLTACSGGTTVIKTVTEEVTKVYTVEEDGTVKYEDLIPEEIELDGSTLNLSSYEEVEGDAPKETKTTTKTETEKTDDPFLIYKDEIKAFLYKYLALITSALVLLVISIAAIIRYRCRYDLWW